MARVKSTAGGAEEWDEAAPRPVALIESLRSFGYSPETAVADLLDNSMSAGASNMKLHFEWAGRDSHVAIVDDGRGMDETTLLEAMRPGSISPLSTRAASDLGRFGLGLKTASFSQARELTVITRDAAERVHVRRWDLDLVEMSGQWRLLRSPPGQAAAYLDVVARDGGTAVVWSKCDRLVGDVEHDPERAADRFYTVVDQVREHLGATFHRFLTGRGARAIRVNDVAVEPWEPILKHPATHLVTTEKLPFRGTRVEVRAYVLPHRSKLSEQQQRAGAGIRGWNAQQGFYVYRNQRLVVSGDWLGVGGAKDEHTKLGRITIDFDSELDLDWQIDVKKSTARPPGSLLPDLRRIAAATRRQAEEVYRLRGVVLRDPRGGRGERPLVTAWAEYKERSGEVRLRLNRSHPVLALALAGTTQQKRTVERVLRFVEETLPTSLIGIRLSEALDKQIPAFEAKPEEVAKLLKWMLEEMIKTGARRDTALDQLRIAEPFCNFPALLQAAQEEDL